MSFSGKIFVKLHESIKGRNFGIAISVVFTTYPHEIDKLIEYVCHQFVEIIIILRIKRKI